MDTQLFAGRGGLSLMNGVTLPSGYSTSGEAMAPAHRLGVDMRRDRILGAIGALCDAIEESQIRDLLRGMRMGEGAEGESRTRKILLAHSKFMQHYNQFDDLEKELTGVLGLGPLADTEFWSHLLEGGQSVDRKLLSDLEAAAFNATAITPKLKALLGRETDAGELIVADARAAAHKIKCLRILIAEERRSLTSPVTIVNVLRAMDKLYETFSALYGKDAVGLTVGSIDSGNGKSFDFFGTSPIMEEISRLILEVWDRVKYADENSFGYQIEHAMISTGFMLRVKKLVADDERAQGAIANVAKCIEILFRSGAHTEDMDKPRDIRASHKLNVKSNSLQFEAVKTGIEEGQGGNTASSGAEEEPVPLSVAGLVPAIAVMLSKKPA